MSHRLPPISYNDYLKVDQVIALQDPRSVAARQPAHDETLFIIVHQTYELWFKQILVELDSVLVIFSTDEIAESEMGTAVHRLERIEEIWKLLIQQITVLETMTPLDFLDFRDVIYPASGFQSVQNRLIENKLGLRSDQRMQFNGMPYHAFVDEKQRAELIHSETQPSLFECIDAWLARTPFLKSAEFNFWASYRQAVDRLFEDDRKSVQNHRILNDEEKARGLAEVDRNREVFEALFNESRFNELKGSGAFRLSYPAVHAALLIQLYRDEPALQLPFRLLTSLQNIDELMTTWRYRHALMAHRMIGRKVGTGGSSGADYLKSATDKHRIYNDFFNLATFLIPRSRLPKMPDAMKKQLGFRFSYSTST
jgi:tryptophan 2,3-dioxygenase